MFGVSDQADDFPAFTEADMEFLRGCLPAEQELMIGWATPVLAASPGERLLLVAAQIEVLEGLWDDPEEWCGRALKLAIEARGGHHG